jgi:hypothetical protein
VATDNDNLREKSLRALLSASWIDAAKRQPTIAVITCSDRPEVLLLPTHDRATFDAFLKAVHLYSSGGTTIAATVRLLGQLPGCQTTSYLGDGLLTSDHLPSSKVVRQLPATLATVYGKTPRLHAIAIDASHEVFSRTEPAWTAITEGRVVKARSAADIDQAVNTIARNLLWLKTTSPRSHPETVPTLGDFHRFQRLEQSSLSLLSSLCSETPAWRSLSQCSRNHRGKRPHASRISSIVRKTLGLHRGRDLRHQNPKVGETHHASPTSSHRSPRA